MFMWLTCTYSCIDIASSSSISQSENGTPENERGLPKLLYVYMWLICMYVIMYIDIASSSTSQPENGTPGIS